MAVKKSGLGRGLTSLFDENSSDNEGAVTLNLNDIEPNRDQPRKDLPTAVHNTDLYNLLWLSLI